MDTEYKVIISALIFAIVGLLYIAYSGGAAVEQENEALYCEMVQIHKDSLGEYGWPAYKGECK